MIHSTCKTFDLRRGKQADGVVPEINSALTSVTISYDPLLGTVEPFDTEFHYISIVEVLRWVQAKTNSLRGARRDNVSRQERHKLAEVSPKLQTK